MDFEEDTFVYDQDGMISDKDFQLLNPETRRAVESKGSVLTWVHHPEFQKNLQGVAFRPPSGKIVPVNDPEGKIRWWNIENRDEKYVPSEIEDEGALMFYVNNEGYQEKIKRYHFNPTPFEIIRKASGSSEMGDVPNQWLFTIIVGYFANAVVVGFYPFKYEGYRCLNQINRSEASGYEYERWFGSMMDMTDNSNTECFLRCTKTGELTDKEYRQMFQEVFPTLHVQHREGQCTIRLKDIYQAILLMEARQDAERTDAESPRRSSSIESD